MSQASHEEPHRLLASTGVVGAAAYSATTVRRAILTWLHCGSKLTLSTVAGYYHRLEALEDEMPPDQRAASRHPEFQLFSNAPPSSEFLRIHFPHLYDHNAVPAKYIKKLEAIKIDQFVFHLEGFIEMNMDGVTKEELLQVSKMIRRHCSEHQIELRRFLKIFKEYLRRTEQQNSVRIVKMYIKKKDILAEIRLETNMPKHFEFLENNDFDDVMKHKIATPKEKANTLESLTKPKQNGSVTNSIDVSMFSQMRFMNSVKPKTIPVKIVDIKTATADKVARLAESLKYSSISINDSAKMTVDKVTPVTILKRNGQNGVSLKVMRS